MAAIGRQAELRAGVPYEPYLQSTRRLLTQLDEDGAGARPVRGGS